MEGFDSFQQPGAGKVRIPGRGGRYRSSGASGGGALFGNGSNGRGTRIEAGSGCWFGGCRQPFQQAVGLGHPKQPQEFGAAPWREQAQRPSANDRICQDGGTQRDRTGQEGEPIRVTQPPAMRGLTVGERIEQRHQVVCS